MDLHRSRTSENWLVTKMYAIRAFRTAQVAFHSRLRT